MTDQTQSSDLTPKEMVQAGWADWQRLFWFASVVFLCCCYVLVLCFFVGDMYRNGYLAWVPGDWGAFLAGTGIGAGGVGVASIGRK